MAARCPGTRPREKPLPAHPAVCSPPGLRGEMGPRAGRGPDQLRDAATSPQPPPRGALSIPQLRKPAGSSHLSSALTGHLGRGSGPLASPRGASQENWGELGLQKSASQARSSPGEPPAQPGALDRPEPAARAGRIKAAAQKAGAGAAGLPEHTDPAVSAPPQRLHLQNLRVRKEGPELRASLAVRPAGAPVGPQGAGTAPRKPPLSPVAWLVPLKRRSEEG